MEQIDIRVSESDMKKEFVRILLKHGFKQDESETLALVFTANSLDGVYTHGVNRFPRFIQYTKEGVVLPGKTATLIHTAGNIEQWDGNLGPGPINALHCTNRAIEIASTNGLGCVALGNTNHWMRGGYYGWEAAKTGCVLIAWTNTMGIMPAWGSSEPKLGNNPMVFSVPFNNSAIVLDTALAQYSYGSMELYEMRKEMLSVPGGFDADGKLTQDPAAILKTRRPLPIGYWKGSGLSLLLDILAFSLSGGLSTSDISKRSTESSVCQIFIAISLKNLKNFPSINDSINKVVEDFKQSIPVEPQKKVRYPGERVLSTRKENAEKEIPVLKKVWDEITAL